MARKKKDPNALIFSWRYKDYGLEAQPKRLVRFTPDEPNETIDFVKYHEEGKSVLKYSIGVFYWDESNKTWQLNFVGDRFMDIVSADLPAVWEGLKSAYNVLTLWKSQNQNEDL